MQWLLFTLAVRALTGNSRVITLTKPPLEAPLCGLFFEPYCCREEHIQPLIYLHSPPSVRLDARCHPRHPRHPLSPTSPTVTHVTHRHSGHPLSLRSPTSPTVTQVTHRHSCHPRHLLHRRHTLSPTTRTYTGAEQRSGNRASVPLHTCGAPTSQT